jgi:hypothetical protein
MKIKLLIVAIICAAVNYTNAQMYSTAIGVKGGGYNYYGFGGLNLKHDFGSFYGDFTLGGNRGSFSFSALAEKQQELSGNVEWYYGVGAYINNWRDGYGAKWKNQYYYNDHWGVGAIAALGIEYTFDDFPLNIGVDVGPSVNIIPYFGIGWGGSVFLRFAIK